jgi:hypothetical protein
MSNKPKLCKWTLEKCDEERVNYPGKSILSPYCHSHLISATLIKVRSTKELNKTIRAKNKENKEKTIELLTTDRYRKKYVQPIFNEIARLIDYNQPCIATGNYKGKMAGGHYHSVGSNRTICLNLHNIHIQSFQSNGPKGGDNIKYREGIIKTYGLHYLEQIEALSLIKPIKLDKSDLMDIKIHASAIKKQLKKELRVRTPDERINLREVINNQIGIYK